MLNNTYLPDPKKFRSQIYYFLDRFSMLPRSGSPELDLFLFAWQPVAKRIFNNLNIYLAILLYHFTLISNNILITWIPFSTIEYKKTICLRKRKSEFSSKVFLINFLQVYNRQINYCLKITFYSLVSRTCLHNILVFYINIVIIKFVLSKIISLITIFKKLNSFATQHLMFSGIRVKLNETEMSKKWYNVDMFLGGGQSKFAIIEKCNF